MIGSITILMGDLMEFNRVSLRYLGTHRSGEPMLPGCVLTMQCKRLVFKRNCDPWVTLRRLWSYSFEGSVFGSSELQWHLMLLEAGTGCAALHHLPMRID